jgi:hypothetical protein
MATSAERMRALRERQRRGLRRLTIEVSEDDLRAIAKRGYEDAVTTDHDQQAQAVATACGRSRDCLRARSLHPPDRSGRYCSQAADCAAALSSSVYTAARTRPTSAYS